MESKSLEDFLHSWGLSMYVDKFKDQKIEDINMLQLLSQEDIKELIPILGHRVKLTAEIKQLKQIINTAYPTDEHEHNILNIGDVTPSNDISFSSILNTAEFCVMPLETPAKEEPKSELYKLLQSSNEGKTLLLQFEESGLLDNLARRRLCNLIINEELKNDPDKKITSARFYQIAYDITQIFKKEYISVYFIPYTCLQPRQKTAAKGKLLDCYRHRRRDFIKSGLVKGRPRSANPYTFDSSPSASSYCPSPTGQELIDEEVSEKLKWLKISCDPWMTVELYWSQTYKARLQNFTNLNFTISQYFNEYLALQQSKGLYLLLSDFNTIYPENRLSFIENWPSIKFQIIQLAKKRKESFINEILSSSTDENEDSTDTASFMVLPFLLSTITIKTKAKKPWRPSKLEVLEGFITHLHSAADLDASILRRKEKFERLQLSLQPYIILVGPTINEITDRYIVINTVRNSPLNCIKFQCSSTINAVDNCFKIIFALNAEFQAECAHVWTFIQKTVYKLSTKFDKNYTSVNSLLADLGIP